MTIFFREINVIYIIFVFNSFKSPIFYIKVGQFCFKFSERNILKYYRNEQVMFEKHYFKIRNCAFKIQNLC